MTEQEAIDVANQYIQANNIEVSGLDYVKYADASNVPRRLGVPNDFWIVAFAEFSVSDDVVSSIGGTILNIDDVSGKVTVVG